MRDLNSPTLSAIGLKILLDIMTASPRPLGSSSGCPMCSARGRWGNKLDYVVAMEYLIALYDRMFGRVVPVRFVMFSGIGAPGAGVHFLVLGVLFRGPRAALCRGDDAGGARRDELNFFATTRSLIASSD